MQARSEILNSMLLPDKLRALPEQTLHISDYCRVTHWKNYAGTADTPLSGGHSL